MAKSGFAVSFSRNPIFRDITFACLVGFGSYLTAVFGGALALRPQRYGHSGRVVRLVAIYFNAVENLARPDCVRSGGFVAYDLQEGLAIRQSLCCCGGCNRNSCCRLWR